MSMKKVSLLFLTLLVAFVTNMPRAFANEGKECKADADCEHGEHCKEGHCHK